MFGELDDMFDLNVDGKLDDLEKAGEFGFIMNENKDELWDGDDDHDSLDWDADDADDGW